MGFDNLPTNAMICWPIGFEKKHFWCKNVRKTIPFFCCGLQEETGRTFLCCHSSSAFFCFSSLRTSGSLPNVQRMRPGSPQKHLVHSSFELCGGLTHDHLPMSPALITKKKVGGPLSPEKKKDKKRWRWVSDSHWFQLVSQLDCLESIASDIEPSSTQSSNSETPTTLPVPVDFQRSVCFAKLECWMRSGVAPLNLNWSNVETGRLIFNLKTGCGACATNLKPGRLNLRMKCCLSSFSKLLLISMTWKFRSRKISKKISALGSSCWLSSVDFYGFWASGPHSFLAGSVPRLPESSGPQGAMIKHVYRPRLRSGRFEPPVPRGAKVIQQRQTSLKVRLILSHSDELSEEVVSCRSTINLLI